MKKILFLSIVLSVAALAGFVSLEPGLTSAASDQATTTVTLNVDAELSLSCDAAETMTPNIGLSQDASVGTSTCTVITSNDSGYVLTVRATSAPAMTSGSNYFSDFATTTAPATWSVGAGEYLFGFTAYGENNDTKFESGGSATSCGNAGAATYTGDTNSRYIGFYTTATTTASSNGETDGDGEVTTYCYVAEQGDSVSAPSGTYTAVLEFTATTQ